MDYSRHTPRISLAEASLSEMMAEFQVRESNDEYLGPTSQVSGASITVDVGSHRDLQRTEGYVRLGTDKYDEGRVLAYSRSRDSDLYKDEGEIYQRWLAAQLPAVESVPYTTPNKIRRRPSESSEGCEFDGDGRTECVAATTEPLTEENVVVAHLEELCPKPPECSDRASEGSESNQLKFEGAYLSAATVSEDRGDRDDSNASEHPVNDIEFEDYWHFCRTLPRPAW
ncbi:unnamed protein product [Phytophthora fragariaefolia]|uniref:Unnamed protein product n=1 Tax=Phytophthora fragariaefolia TaxID=1490495 RepID=A0A9W7CG79_9STRA|nr:unnamed protein product [Phytophthora fragariaefolia]